MKKGEKMKSLRTFTQTAVYNELNKLLCTEIDGESQK